VVCLLAFERAVHDPAGGGERQATVLTPAIDWLCHRSSPFGVRAPGRSNDAGAFASTKYI
jgi:hypothetical protein